MLKSKKIAKGINGIAKIPGDKSISHRSIIIPSISKGLTEIKNILKSEDVIRTMNAFKSMGVKIEELKNKIIKKGPKHLRQEKSEKIMRENLTMVRENRRLDP